MSARPFLDLYFKWDQRPAAGSCERRLLGGPDLPCSGSLEWLWPTLGFPGSTRCPYRLPQQGGDCAGVSPHLKRFSGCFPEGLRPLVPWCCLGTFCAPGALSALQTSYRTKVHVLLQLPKTWSPGVLWPRQILSQNISMLLQRHTIASEVRGWSKGWGGQKATCILRWGLARPRCDGRDSAMEEGSWSPLEVWVTAPSRGVGAQRGEYPRDLTLLVCKRLRWRRSTC